jgi:hypothetical protein
MMHDSGKVITMKTLVGIFHSPEDAEAAVQKLVAKGFSQDQFVLLTPQGDSSSLSPHDAKPEPLGACGASAGQVGGAITGFAGGILSGAIISLALPGVGPLIAIGALAVGGSFGAVAGGVVGNLVQETYVPTLPPDDLFIYEEALRQRAYLLIIQPSDDRRAQMASEILDTHKALSTIAAWDQWWQRLAKHEAAAYETNPSLSFSQIEREYRRGFQAALDGRLRGKPTADQEALLTQYYEEAMQPGFRQGFARGVLYYQALAERGDPKRTEAFAGVK